MNDCRKYEDGDAKDTETKALRCRFYGKKWFISAIVKNGNKTQCNNLEKTFDSEKYSQNITDLCDDCMRLKMQ